ncbi:hypothetical protein CHLRE_17g719500v5 [Chlamydomonas reinhardtii]|uniref:Amine oxidase domain-containing protein n=1 Tax=Chlamydomonas reinhardtii TaxID=3055 RepID=A0A2K3CQ67_CHLRE|nr:uncharacterized protein CHLRE_17g719500v5 [Chlamydomonas reinhardtii]PNW70427.1 hypothetical protein CHLRE_17g719500v5 [Chlamydomonas reinhardtii]
MHSSSVYSRKTCPRSVGGPAACRLHAVSSIARAASRTTALRAAATSESQTASGGSNGSPQRRGPKAVVVGGGWAGFGAAYALSQAGADVTVLDAAEQPGGLASSWKSQGGKTVEPGIKGFWYQYANIFSLVDRLGLRNVFTEFTQSSFYTPEGLQVRSPLFQSQPRLPTPLGSFVYTAPYFTQLPLADRLTAGPLIGPLLEYSADAEAYEAYDKISALELFRSAGVSARLYREFLEPILLVTLFAPGHKLSAAAALDALYYFALAHQPDFDTRWCRGSVSERILQPFAAHLAARGVTLLGGRKVVEVLPGAEGGRRPGRVVATAPGGEREVWEADAVVFATGIGAMQRLVAASPVLADQPFFTAFNNLSCVDAAAVRVWLDRRIRPATPSNVLVRFQPDVGSTLFHLSELQDEYSATESARSSSVVEADFYHAAALLPLSDEQLVEDVVMKQMIPAVDPASRPRVVDSSVLRFRGAVSLFSPGCAAHMPTTRTPFANTFMAGDWVRQGPGTHAAKGLCQEKAYVTGLQAGNAAAEALRLQPRAVVLPGEEDETHIAAGRAAVRELRRLAAAAAPRGVPSPLGGFTLLR